MVAKIQRTQSVAQWEKEGGWKHPSSLAILPPRTHKPVGKPGQLEGMIMAGLGPAGAAVFSNPFDVAKVRTQYENMCTLMTIACIAAVWQRVHACK
jgi:hypothetical protein